MVTKRLLIDASHPEETRVLVVNKEKLEDFDVEFESRRPLKGNIYLAKVTRVEPSLQAAFVDFGGNRHGFLAFNEIHPDYYQIPVADREALKAEARAEAETAHGEDYDEADFQDGSALETLGGDDIDEIEARRSSKHRRNYKIQEVIKRRQILLVQVVKEERGTKGAALSTFLSLAGRYCVLMPNTDRGGGISRKIGNATDRKRLKSIVSQLGIAEGMAVIVRTAGSKRSRAEIRRDYDYLLRLWHQVREMTLNSIAPCLVHEEGNLIKRTIRDLYTKEIDEIIVHGEDGYRMAKDFMKILIPSHAKKVQKYKTEGVAMTRGYNIEEQLSTLHSPEVHMKSGAYFVINPTEALVSIDVNSGRSTKERNIEETALRTNIEAAEEIARQLRLRDLAGLIVIDFIDMEIHRNHVRVERALKDAMRPDRARIQIGRISPFGLLELSRQRLRPSLIESSSEPCPYCAGTGIRRSTDTTALEVIRAIEEEGMRTSDSNIKVFAPTSVALFVLNNKRQTLISIEEKYGLSITFEGDDTLIPPAIRIERENDDGTTQKVKRADPQHLDSNEEANKQRRRRRRGRKRGRREDNESGVDPEISEAIAHGTQTLEVTSKDEEGESLPNVLAEKEDRDATRRRRRGRRGGKRRRRNDEEELDVTNVVIPGDAEFSKSTTLVNKDTPKAPGPAKLSEEKVKEVDTFSAASQETKTAETKPLVKPKVKRSRKKIADPEHEEQVTNPNRTKDGAKIAEEPASKRRRNPTRIKTGEITGLEEKKKKASSSASPKAKGSNVPLVGETNTIETKLSDLETNKVPPVQANKANATEVINVGDHSTDNTNPRRGWWQRT